MKTYKSLLILAIALVLIFNITIAIFMRTKHIEVLQGKYLVGFDPYLYYYQAKTIIKDGNLPQQDNMRYVPIGIQTNQRANLNSYAIAYFYKIIHIFIPSVTLEQATIAYPVFCFALTLIVFTLFVNKLFSRAVALLSITFLAILPSLEYRTMAGFADRDALYLLEMFLIFYLVFF